MTPYKRFSFWMVQTRVGRWWMHRLYSTVGPGLDRLLFRLSRGRLTTGTGVVPILLLTTTGRRTGRPRTTPVAYLRDGQDIVLVASNVGNPGHPQWFLNLQAQPVAQLSIGARTQTYTARVVTGPERDRLWHRLTAHAPTYAMYQARAGRDLPVLIMTPTPS